MVKSDQATKPRGRNVEKVETEVRTVVAEADELKQTLTPYLAAGWQVAAVTVGGVDSNGAWRSIAFFTAVLTRKVED